YLTRFQPNFIVRQNTFNLPVFIYDVSQPDMLAKVVAHAKVLRTDGVKLITLKDVETALLKKNMIDGKSAVMAVSGITPQNVKDVSSALYSNTIPATLFIQTKNLGLSGITQKTVS